MVESGEISQEDADRAAQFIDLAGQPTFNIFILARSGHLDHLQGDENFQATLRVLETMGLGAIEFNPHTAQPVEEQFWDQFDGVFALNEVEMREELPNFITDPNNRAKVEALLGGDADAAIPAEETVKLA